MGMRMAEPIIKCMADVTPRVRTMWRSAEDIARRFKEEMEKPGPREWPCWDAPGYGDTGAVLAALYKKHTGKQLPYVRHLGEKRTNLRLMPGEFRPYSVLRLESLERRLAKSGSEYFATGVKCEMPSIGRTAVTNRLRFSILERDQFRCVYCGRTSAEVRLQVDHVVSVHDGGTNDPGNLATACVDCNAGKSAKSLTQEQRPAGL